MASPIWTIASIENFVDGEGGAGSCAFAANEFHNANEIAAAIAPA
jgi:hypothetical protein